MHVVNKVAEYPVLRPCISMDKEEIIQHAKRIDSYDISIRPGDDCCSLFSPKEPVTRARDWIIEEEEAKRRAIDEDTSVMPLQPAAKKRKKSEKDDYAPSTASLAFMILSDPFVIRIIIARVLRELRKDVCGSTALPCKVELEDKSGGWAAGP